MMQHTIVFTKLLWYYTLLLWYYYSYGSSDPSAYWPFDIMTNNPAHDSHIQLFVTWYHVYVARFWESNQQQVAIVHPESWLQKGMHEYHCWPVINGLLNCIFANSKEYWHWSITCLPLKVGLNWLPLEHGYEINCCLIHVQIHCKSKKTGPLLFLL